MYCYKVSFLKAISYNKVAVLSMCMMYVSLHCVYVGCGMAGMAMEDAWRNASDMLTCMAWDGRVLIVFSN